MSVAAFIRRCLDAGMPVDMALTAAEAFEAEAPVFAPPVRSKGAERAARYRQNKRDGSVTDRDAVTESVTTGDDVTEEQRVSFSPRPPNPTQNTPPFTPLKGGVSLPKSNGFARFWEAYPNKTAKRAADKAFTAAVKRIPDADPLSLMLAGIDRAKRSRKWRDGFIPNPATWLNGDCWEDDPEGELARAKPSALPKPEPAVYAAHVRHFQDTGEWKPSWGAKPEAEAAA